MKTTTRTNRKATGGAPVKAKPRIGNAAAVNAVVAAPPAPPSQQRYFGRNLNHARKVAGFTLRELADQVGCSESLLSKIENEKATPSLQMLHRIVTCLNTSIGALFTNEEPGTRVVSRRGERPVISTGHAERSGKVVGVDIEWLVPYPESKLLSGSIHKIAPQGGSCGAIVHKGEEVGYVLKGSFELTVDGIVYTLNEGDSFMFSSERPHGYRNPGDVEAWILWINTPPTF
ncbi:cupin domain-containing protein [Paraburkholderia sp.]|uniref:cupin domain-containing protein n=1 Tax=Paraburkholderia sp. TaxID=1926495 RepID=UPI0039E4498F